MDDKTKSLFKHLLEMNASSLGDLSALYTLVAANLPNLTDEQRLEFETEAKSRLDASQKIKALAQTF